MSGPPPELPIFDASARDAGPQHRLGRAGSPRGADGAVRPIHIAVADDDPGVGAALADVIRSQPTLELVGTARDGRQAIDLVVSVRPDVVLMDVNMPDVDGAAATREIRDRGLPTRVVALSAHEDRATLLDMLRAGAVGYLVKGCPVDEIVQAVQRAAEGLSTLSAEVSAELVDEMATRLEQDERVAGRRRELIRRVSRAIDEGPRIVLQPIVDLVTGRAVGVEALSRFSSSPPLTAEQWFTDASEVGMRTDLELVAIRAALVLRSSLPESVGLSLNVGPDTLQSPRFTQTIREATLEGLVLEITEHAPVDDYSALAAVLAPLRDLGVRIAVDDAGAGFASLRHILRLDPDIIKIDKELTRGLDDDRPRRALATALISFANEIGAEIVAEGVEHPAEVDALRQLGVRLGQGFYLGGLAPVERCLDGVEPESVTGVA